LISNYSLSQSVHGQYSHHPRLARFAPWPLAKPLGLALLQSLTGELPLLSISNLHEEIV
jgi:hypothetical protein